MDVTTDARVAVLQVKLDELNDYGRELNARYDRSADGSDEKAATLRAMGALQARRAEVERELEELIP